MHTDSDIRLTQHDPAIDVSVILVNWNGLEHLEVCLSSLLRQNLAAELILVDNGSTDDSLVFVRQHFGEQVHIVELPENIGYGAGINAGIRQLRDGFSWRSTRTQKSHRHAWRR